jgi:hypothetical protein
MPCPCYLPPRFRGTPKGLQFCGGRVKKHQMLIGDLYSLLPAFTLAAFLTILLWPENIAFKSRLRLFAVVLVIWVAASFIGMSGYGTAERWLICFINAIVGCLGLLGVLLTHQIKPSRSQEQNR